MEITWYGLSCFRLSERGTASVVTDPYDHHRAGGSSLKLSAEIVTISRDEPAHNYLEAVQGAPYIVRGPGEYEVGGVFITGIAAGGHKGSEHAPNTLFVFDFNPMTVAHLGNLSRMPTQSEIEAMGTVNIALIPVGGGSGFNATRAAEVISMLSPNIVVPMLYATPQTSLPLEPLSKFLKEMGVSDYQSQPQLRVSNTNLPEETQVLVLEDQGE
jgi:L-ascorbate metabolism protein UlaG (beta-lactamase superfamily)